MADESKWDWYPGVPTVPKNFKEPDLSDFQWLDSDTLDAPIEGISKELIEKLTADENEDAQAFSESLQRQQLGTQGPSGVAVLRNELVRQMKAKAAKVRPDCGSALKPSLMHHGHYCPECGKSFPNELIYDTPQPLPTGAKENPMDEEKTATAFVAYRDEIPTPTLLSEFADAAARGLKIGASRAAVKKLVSIARQALGESYPKFFDTTIGQQIESAAVCGVVLLVCNQWTSMPKRDLIKSVALLGVESSSSETAQLVGSVVAPWIESVAAELVGAAPELLPAAPRQIEGE